LYVDEDGEVIRGEEVVVDECVVPPPVLAAHHHVLSGRRSVSLDERECVVVEGESECGGLEGEEGGKEDEEHGATAEHLRRRQLLPTIAPEVLEPAAQRAENRRAGGEIEAGVGDKEVHSWRAHGTRGRCVCGCGHVERAGDHRAGKQEQRPHGCRGGILEI
jgi:hypothetical protein